MSKAHIYKYYILGDRPIKVTCNQIDIPIKAEIYSAKEGGFVSDLDVIKMITDDRDIKTIDRADFENACLAKGLKAI